METFLIYRNGQQIASLDLKCRPQLTAPAAALRVADGIYRKAPGDVIRVQPVRH
jgi:hypothetical protein